jgi:hypothetical protein
MRDLISPRFALLHRAAKAFECFEEKRLHVVWLKPTRVGTFHLFPDAVNARGIH